MFALFVVLFCLAFIGYLIWLDKQNSIIPVVLLILLLFILK